MTCGICGRTALYRWGGEGRCQTHRMSVPPAVLDFRARMEARADALDEFWRDKDRASKRAALAHGHAKFGKSQIA